MRNTGFAVFLAGWAHAGGSAELHRLGWRNDGPSPVVMIPGFRYTRLDLRPRS
jgi:hypothetical protein